MAHKPFQKILKTKKMPNEWQKNTLVPIYKNKGDIQNCLNYMGIKLMSHTMTEARDTDLGQPIWVHARTLNHGGNLSFKKIYGKM